MRVRATEDFKGYYPATCTVVTARTGQEFSGEVAAYLLGTGSPVEALEDAPAPEAPPAPPAAPPADPEQTDPATPEAPVEPVGFDPALHTIADVIEYVKANPGERAAVLAAETGPAGRNRSTLTAALA